MTRPGPGKFEACPSLEVAEILYAIVQNGFVDAQVGGSIGDIVADDWHGLILWSGPSMTEQIIEADPSLIDAGVLTDEMRSEHEAAFGDEHDPACPLCGADAQVQFAFVIHEDSDGFFTYEVFESDSAAQIVFDEWERSLEVAYTSAGAIDSDGGLTLGDHIEQALRASDIVWTKYGSDTIPDLTRRIVQIVRDNTTYEGN